MSNLIRFEFYNNFDIWYDLYQENGGDPNYVINMIVFTIKVNYAADLEHSFFYRSAFEYGYINMFQARENCGVGDFYGIKNGTGAGSFFGYSPRNGYGCGHSHGVGYTMGFGEGYGNGMKFHYEDILCQI